MVTKGEQGRVDWYPATQSKCDLRSWVQWLVQPPQTSQSTVSHCVNLQGRVAQGSDYFSSGLWILSKKPDHQSVIGRSALRCRNPSSVALKRLFYRISPTPSSVVEKHSRDGTQLASSCKCKILTIRQSWFKKYLIMLVLAIICIVKYRCKCRIKIKEIFTPRTSLENLTHLTA